MAGVKFSVFRGAVPRVSERQLAARFARTARNIKITSGNIEPLKGLAQSELILMDSPASIFRYRHAPLGVTPDENWLTFADDTDLVNSPIASDENSRIFWTADVHDPRMSTYDTAISGLGPYPAGFFMLGVPSPTAQPSASASGGTAPTTTRSYCYTYVTALGEESGPSPASTVASGNNNGTWTVTGIQTAPTNSGTSSGWVTLPNGRIRATLDTVFGMQIGSTLIMTYDTVELVDPLVETVRVLAVNAGSSYVEFARAAYPVGTTPTLAWERASPINITGMVKRLYRTDGTASSFMYVTELAIGDTSYADSAAVSTGEPLQTAATVPPPGNLRCLIALPNGCLCGMTENEICFSEPYIPYSWPVINRYSFVAKGVTIGATGNSVIVLTDGYPVLATGSDPEAMTITVMETYAPCVSKRGSVNVGGGVLYPSHDGLWLAMAGAVELRTRALYRVSEWKPLAPETFNAEFFDGQYYAVHTPVGGTQQIIVLDVAELDSVITVDESADAIYRNDYDGIMYIAKGGTIYKWDENDNKRYNSEWQSVEVQLDQPRNLSVAQVHADWSQVVQVDESPLASNQALIDSGPDAVSGYIGADEFGVLEVASSYIELVDPATERRVQFVLYDGESAIYSRNVDSGRPFRLPAGHKQETLRIALNASITVFSSSVAESTEELRGISA